MAEVLPAGREDTPFAKMGKWCFSALLLLLLIASKVRGVREGEAVNADTQHRSDDEPRSVIAMQGLSGDRGSF